MQRAPILDYIRHVLAFQVIIYHTYALTGLPAPIAFGLSPGQLAVYGFFLLSGHLITQSYRRDPRPIPFVVRRAARIAPAWIAAIALGALLARLCGGFAANPWRGTINASLWTLPWEIVCYAAVVLLRGRAWLLAAPATLAFGLDPHAPAPLLLCFALGSLLPRPRALRLPQLPADYSYGMYVYAFPISQALVSTLHPSRGALGLLTLACLIPLCALSWRLVEKPALRLASRRVAFPGASIRTQHAAPM